ncbi:MAG: thioredoxin-disulfide reductase [Caldilineae bacterium]|nr:thioredoxin-disulfide reductase [Anaerolineae bacterium]MCB0256170.1 thioredoxin-disulfide reductase [Anaerolineae bacterium]MCB9152646.1 thioredoxin-disulfide reductase [Caldilineae bacterium]
MSDNNVEKMIIIGSGPAGFTAALYTARANLNPLVITGNEIGGQVAITYEVENYPGFPEGLTGPEMVEKFQKQAEKFGARIEYDYVSSVDFTQHPFTVSTASGKEYRAESVIVSTGATPRKLGVPGEKEYTGFGVSYCGTCDGFFFRGKEVLVVGGGDSALEEGIFLTKFANKVTVIHRRDELRASKILQNRAFNNEKMDFKWSHVVERINASGSNGNGAPPKVVSATLRNLKTNEVYDYPTDGVFIFIGHTPNSQLFGGQLEIDESGYVVTDKRMHTSVHGVFAGGEIQDSVFRQVVTSAGQGAAAAMEAEKFLGELEAQSYEEIAAEHGHPVKVLA